MGGQMANTSPQTNSMLGAYLGSRNPQLALGNRGGGMLDDIGRLAKSILASQGGGGFQEGGMGIQIGRGPQMTGRPTLYEDGSMMNPFTNPRSAGLPQQGPLPGQRPVGQLSPQLLMILMQMQQASNERRRRMMQSKFPTLF